MEFSRFFVGECVGFAMGMLCMWWIMYPRLRRLNAIDLTDALRKRGQSLKGEQVLTSTIVPSADEKHNLLEPYTKRFNNLYVKEPGATTEHPWKK